MKHETSYQAFYVPLGIAAFFLIGGIVLGGALNSGTAFFKSTPRLAVVDMQALVAKRSQQLAKTGSHKSMVDSRAPGKGTAKISSHQIREAGEQLKEVLEAFAARHHLILLAKGAVMGGSLPDYTEEIMQDAFPDERTRLRTFMEKKITSYQRDKVLQAQRLWLESHHPKGSQLESFHPKSFQLESFQPGSRENQP